MRLMLVGFVVLVVPTMILCLVERSLSQAPEPRPQNQQAPGQPPQGAFRLPPPALLEALDKDHDGEVSGDEIKQAESALKSLDKNSDGDLGDQELGPTFGIGF